MSRANASELSEKEKMGLERKMELLKPKMAKAKQQYDALTSQYRELLELRYPERKEERVKDTLYRAFCESDKTLEEILAYMAGEDGEYY